MSDSRPMSQNGRSSRPELSGRREQVEGAGGRICADWSTPASACARRAVAEHVRVTHGHGPPWWEPGRAARRRPALPRGRPAGGDLVALTCPPETVALLCGRTRGEGPAVESDPRMSLLGSRAPDALTMCRRYLERAMARRLGPAARGGRGRLRQRPRRLAGGPALRVGLQPAPGRRARVRVCLYDRRRLPPAVVDSAAATHPQLVRGTTWSASAGGSRTRASTCRPCPLPRDPVEDGDPVFAVDDARTLAGLRHQLGAVIASLVPDRDQQGDLHLAAAEIAANAFRHGVRPVSARVWADGTGSSASSPTAAPPTATRSPASPRPRPRPLPRRYGPLARPQALGPRRRAAERRPV